MMKLPRFCCTAVTLLTALHLATPAIAQAPEAGIPAERDLQDFSIASPLGTVAADEELASRAGASILEAGGNAADAAAAAMLALGVTNPFASGLGGGGFCLYRDAKTKQVLALDFRETAPQKAHRDLYIIDGQARPDLARHGGLAIGTPGEPAGIWSLHGRFGQLSWEEIVAPAQNLAKDGFTVGPMLARHLASLDENLSDWPELRALFEDQDGDLIKEGDLLRRPDLAKALDILADQGVHPFYVGEIADAIVDAAQKHGGILTQDDLAYYSVVPREAVTGRFKDFEIHAMPPPSSGGVALIEAFNILDQFDLEELDKETLIHLQVEALKTAFADRARWLGDSDFVDVPVELLTSQKYAAQRATQLKLDATLDPNSYGTHAPPDELGGTAHLSVADHAGNLAACTTTVNTRFGSYIHLPKYGLILNNQMADFNIEPGKPNLYGLIGDERNAVAPKKRPLSSMSPTLVTRDNEPMMTIGASGGPTIISGVYFTLLHAFLDDAQPLAAVTAPRIHHQWMPHILFVESQDLPFVKGLQQRGHDVQPRPAYNSVQFIRHTDDEWRAVSDPRKRGIPAAPTTIPNP